MRQIDPKLPLVTGCQKWVAEGPCFEDNIMLWITEGSRNGGSEGEIRGPDVRLIEPLSASDVHAIIAHKVQGKTCPDSSLAKESIFFHSQIALKAHQSCTFEFLLIKLAELKLLWNCWEDLAHQNEMNLIRVPSHHGISCSEAADRLAMAGLACLFTDPKPFC